MAQGRLLIIEADEWEAALLGKFLTDAGYTVEFAAGAREGFDKIRESKPDCILCDVSLPDIDGFWVARRVRTETSAVATTPFLFLISADDSESRLQGLHVGADLSISKPFRNEEVVAQVGAVLEMANRLKAQQALLPSDGPPSSRGSALQGDLSLISLSTVLTLLELERRTGNLKVTAEDGGAARIELLEGTLALATLNGDACEPTELLRQILRWKKGKFGFKPDSVAPGAELNRQSIGGLLLEATRLEDEARR
ncbi:MAG TPA: response regulator [Polyangiaceae bacterium]